MLEKIREGSQGLIAKVILGIVILTFALAGVGSYLGNTAAPPAATVNGVEITKAEFEQRYQSNRARMEQQFGQMFSQLAADESYMKTFREGALEQLIGEQLENQLAEDIGLRVGDEKIKETIRNMQEFQVDGRFDNDRYLAMLRQFGYQPSGFRDYLKVDSVRRQLRQAIQTTDFSLPSEVKIHNELDKQTRDIEYIVFKQADYVEEVTLSDEDRQAYYQEHMEDYRTQEMVSLEYVEIKISDIMKTIAVSDEELEQHYQDNIASYRTNVAERRASHILIEFGDDEDAAKAKIEGLLARVKAGEDFAEVAKEASDDSFSAENGGDLEWFESGAMPDALDEAIFALENVNDITDVVRSEDGFHIAKLTGDKPEAIKPFADVKEQVANEFKRYQANEIFAEKHSQLSEIAFEVPDSLEDAAGAIDANVQETALFSRIGAPVAVNFPPVVQAAFSEQVLVDQMNSEVIEINDDHVMVIRLKQHEPSRIQDIEEVATQIDSALKREKAEELAKAKAEELLAKLDGTQKLADDEDSKAMTIVAKEGVERFTADVDSGLRSEVFKMAKPDEGKFTNQVIQMSNGDYALVALGKVTLGEQPEDTNAIEQRIASQKSQMSYKSFVDSLKESAEIYKEDDGESQDNASE